MKTKTGLYAATVILALAALALAGLPPAAQAAPEAEESARSAPLAQETISAGKDHNCAIRTDGTLAFWGRNDYAQATPAEGTLASAQGPVTNQASSQKAGWSALDKLDAFKQTLKDTGFGLEQGEVIYMDWVKMCCEGGLPHTGANNPAPNAYIALQFGGQPLLWQLGENEAIVMVGQTPPPAAYFSYNTILGYLPLEPGAPANESRPIVGITAGDAINNATIKTIGPDPFNRPIVYIITGHRGTERLVRAAARKAGYPDAIINVETISPVLGPLGRGDKGSLWFLAQRVAVPEDAEELRTFLMQVGALNKVFRVTPKEQLAEQLGDDPEPVPVLRVRGTGHTEMALYPILKKLRAKILEQYGPAVYNQFKELDTKIWELESKDTPIDRAIRGEKPYVGLQRGVAVLGASRDTNYLGSFPNFMLREGENEFVIVYGVNHQKTGKATYSSFSIYADKFRWFGLYNGTTLNRDFGDSAKPYLCPNEAECDPDWQYFYVWKVARDCKAKPYCMEARVNDDPKKGPSATSTARPIGAAFTIGTQALLSRKACSIWTRRRCSSSGARTWSRARRLGRMIMNCCTTGPSISGRTSRSNRDAVTRHQARLADGDYMRTVQRRPPRSCVSAPGHGVPKRGPV